MVMCNQPDESLIGQCEHNITKGFLSHGVFEQEVFILVSFTMIPKGSDQQIFSIIKKFACTAFLYLDPLTVLR